MKKKNGLYIENDYIVSQVHCAPLTRGMRIKFYGANKRIVTGIIQKVEMLGSVKHKEWAALVPYYTISTSSLPHIQTVVQDDIISVIS